MSQTVAAAPLLTIKAVAELTGVAAPTLRAWESRYGIAAAHRTPKGYRVYDDEAIGEIRRMCALLEQGASPRMAADAIRRGRPGSGAAVPGDAGLPDIEEFVDAAARLDEGRLAELLDRASAAASLERLLDHWLFPALRLVGERWEAGGLGIASEHLASAVVMRRLAAFYDAAGYAPHSPKVLIGLPQDATHEIPALAFAAAARRAGLGAVYLGADLPAASWATAGSDPEVRGVVLALTVPADAAAAVAAITAVRAARPDLVVAVGGPAAGLVGADVLRLTGGVREAANQLAEQLFTRR